ncbi:MFS transporter [Nocardioides carbamazepini]|uniref:MFS transporter n=1 Tax=Nocardioides carbamazepini TaxID=2854259 RepID=UPI00214A0308|nr:MFS transporter [Nocardioides carbamazepini]MCR1785085.1 MFS transporter [Nocardioides carbamazepini]
MTLTSPGGDLATRAPEPSRRRGRWIEDWRPEDPDFWETTGAPIARRNLVWSIFAEHLGFSVWLIWSVSSAFLVAQGFAFSPQQLFLLIAIPNLVGALIRVPYTLAVGRFGGRNWTMVSAGLLLVPTLGFAYAVTQPGTPYAVFCVIAATAGFGGGNFASSMANINFFYPARLKGAALGLNAAGGNLGVALIQLFLPVLVGGAGVFGLVQAGAGGIHLERAAWVYAGLAVVAVLAACFRMDNLANARTDTRQQLSILKHRHTWVMAFLYIGTFGSFIGYSAALPLLIKLNFWHQTGPGSGSGIEFAYYAFLGALVGSVTRPLGGHLADRYGGARVTLLAFGGLVLGTLGILGTLAMLTPIPAAGGAAQSAAVDTNTEVFPLFLGVFLLVFACTGIGNGSTYKMIPAIHRADAIQATVEDSPERELALLDGTRRSSAAVGIIGAVGALGGFLIPITFNSPWVSEPLAATRSAFAVFAAFYVACLVVTWAVYCRRGRTYADAGI